MQAYRIPSGIHRTEIVVVNSRFITTVFPVFNTDEVKEALKQIRIEMPDASHHVYAFRVGYGNSVIEGMSDDGEPSGTSGPPTLAVLRGSDLGDILLVTTRYFGGTKLGTGGLVRAYTEAAQTALASLPTEVKAEKRTVGLTVPYSLFEQTRRLIEHHGGMIESEEFGADVTIISVFPLNVLDVFEQALTELSSGQVQLVILD